MADIHRPFGVRRRPDLVVDRLRFGSVDSWIVKDPLNMRFVRLRAEEHEVWQLLDGKRSLTEIRDAYERRFSPQRLSIEELSRFIGQLHAQGLIVADASGQGEVLVERRRKTRSRAAWQRWTNPLAVRFRGIDPQRLLDRVHGVTRWMFSRWAVTAAVLLMASAVALIATQFHTFIARLPDESRLFTPTGFIFLAAALGFVKILHEFGHGVACRHYGGECREMGLMLLVLTPCLYCNVSDAWRFPNKWHRIIVSAAGIYVELILAALATFGWWFSEPGLFHSLCLSVMVVCSINTVVFNGNPLLRYDGYYILADLVEAPNLAERAGMVFRRIVAGLVGDRPQYEDPLMPERNWFWYAFYHVMSAGYRWLVTLSILLFLVHLSRPYQMENIARAVGVILLSAMIWPVVKRLHRWTTTHHGGPEITTRRKVVVTSLVAIVAAFLAFVPLPKRIWAPVDLEPRDGGRVYVEVPGLLVEQIVRTGTVVRTGDVVARLENDEVELQITKLTSERDRLQTAIENADRERFVDASASLRIPELQKSLAATEQQLTEKLDDRRRLTLRADRDGVVFPPLVAPPSVPPAGSLRSYVGRPTDRLNVGCSLAAGTPYCEIGDPHRWQINVIIDHTDVPFVRPGLVVEVVFAEVPDRVYSGVVAEVSQRELTSAPLHMSNKSGGDLVTQTDASGAEIPQTAVYQACVDIDDPEGLLRLGLRGTAKIRTDWEPLGRRIARWCSATLHFQL